MSAPVLAEGCIDFADRASGDFTIVSFGSGVSLMLSRHDLMRLGTMAQSHATSVFKSQTAEIVKFTKKRKTA